MSGEILLWPDGAPGSAGELQIERTFESPDGGQRIVNVTAPALTPLLPDQDTSTGTAVIVAPGGGYRMLSIDDEGTHAAEWLRERGVAAYVLKYRLLDTGTTVSDLLRSFEALSTHGTGDLRRIASDEIRARAKADGEQAVRVVRATGYDNVGFMGFSAGGIVATDVATSDALDARPDFVAAIYGALHDDPIPADAPPLFSMVCADDALCLDACIEAFRAWRRVDRPAELHVYEQGGHGFGMRKLGLPVDGWIHRLGDWMAANHWIGS